MGARESSPNINGTEEDRGAVAWGALEGASWRFIVEQYSSLALTFESDRLMALWGIADAQTQRGVYDGDEYLSGIGVWRSEVVNCLAWTATQNGRYATVNQCIEAPSWSWAAAQGAGVKFEKSYEWEEEPDMKVEMVGLWYEDHVRGEAVLTLRGHLDQRSLKAKRAKHPSGVEWRGERDERTQFFFKFPQKADWDGGFAFSHEGMVELDSPYEVPPDVISLEDVEGLYSFKLCDVTTEKSVIHAYLILKRVGTDAKRFRRVGIMKIPARNVARYLGTEMTENGISEIELL